MKALSVQEAMPLPTLHMKEDRFLGPGILTQDLQEPTVGLLRSGVGLGEGAPTHTPLRARACEPTHCLSVPLTLAPWPSTLLFMASLHPLTVYSPPALGSLVIQNREWFASHIR